MKRGVLEKTFIAGAILTFMGFGLSFAFSSMANEEPYPRSVLEKADKKLQGRTYRVNETKTVAVKDNTRLSVKVGSTDVKFVSHEGEGIKIDLQGTVKTQDAPKAILDVSSTGEIVSVVVRKPPVISRKGSFAFKLNSSKLELTIAWPKSVKLPVEVVAGSADITPELVGFKDLKIELGSGDVTALNISAENVSIQSGSGDQIFKDSIAKAIKLTAGSGDVSLRELKVESVSAKTGSGDISVSEIDGSVSARTGSGDVQVTALSEKPSIGVVTSSGDIKLSLSRAASYELAVTTSSGDFRGNVEVPLGRNSKKNFNTTIGKAPVNGRISLKTSSGDMIIRQ